jgi:hypothetical protein
LRAATNGEEPMPKLNWWAVLVAVLAQQALGFAWYSRALFAPLWFAGIDKRLEDFVPTPAPFVLAFLAALVLATGTAWVLEHSKKSGLKEGLLVGLGVGTAFTMPPVLVHEAFLGYPDAVLAIDGARELVGALVTGAIIGAWPRRTA